MTPRRLGADEVRAALATVPLWRHDAARGAIARRFDFANFGQAFGFMTRVALAAERLQHHPEWSNVYDRVDVVLTTHDVDGLSELDFKLARRADAAHASITALEPHAA